MGASQADRAEHEAKFQQKFTLYLRNQTLPQLGPRAQILADDYLICFLIRGLYFPYNFVD